MTSGGGGGGGGCGGSLNWPGQLERGQVFKCCQHSAAKYHDAKADGASWRTSHTHTHTHEHTHTHIHILDGQSVAMLTTPELTNQIGQQIGPIRTDT